jgi:hypothetical protein
VGILAKFGEISAYHMQNKEEVVIIVNKPWSDI